jgi:hypothetical protein
MESLAEFTERMSNVEKTDEVVVGAWHAGHTRAIFNFEGQHCRFDSIFPSNWLKKSQCWWWTSFEVIGEAIAKFIADQYGGTIEETFYGEPGTYHFVFDEFEKLMRFVYDRYTGEFEKRYGYGKPQKA